MYCLKICWYIVKVTVLFSQQPIEYELQCMKGLVCDLHLCSHSAMIIQGIEEIMWWGICSVPPPSTEIQYHTNRDNHS
jgi:hypothetical protein